MAKVRHTLIFVFIIGFISNWAWENLHSPLYFHPNGEDITQLMLLSAALMDAVIITAVAAVFLSSAYLRSRLWLAFVIGIAIAVAIERFSLVAQRWAYSELMPVIPMLETGLVPTVQLGLLTWLILKCAVRRCG